MKRFVLALCCVMAMNCMFETGVFAAKTKKPAKRKIVKKKKKKLFKKPTQPVIYLGVTGGKGTKVLRRLITESVQRVYRRSFEIRVFTPLSFIRKANKSLCAYPNSLFMLEKCTNDLERAFKAKFAKLGKFAPRSYGLIASVFRKGSHFVVRFSRHRLDGKDISGVNLGRRLDLNSIERCYALSLYRVVRKIFVEAPTYDPSELAKLPVEDCVAKRRMVVGHQLFVPPFGWFRSLLMGRLKRSSGKRDQAYDRDVLFEEKTEAQMKRLAGCKSLTEKCVRRYALRQKASYIVPSASQDTRSSKFALFEIRRCDLQGKKFVCYKASARVEKIKLRMGCREAIANKFFEWLMAYEKSRTFMFTSACNIEPPKSPKAIMITGYAMLGVGVAVTIIGVALHIVKEGVASDVRSQLSVPVSMAQLPEIDGKFSHGDSLSVTSTALITVGGVITGVGGVVVALYYTVVRNKKPKLKPSLSVGGKVYIFLEAGEH